MTFPFIYFLFFCLILLGPSVRSKCFAIFLTLFFFLFFRLSKMMRNDIKPVLSYFYVFTFISINLPRGLKAIREKGEFRRSRSRRPCVQGNGRVLVGAHHVLPPPPPPPPSLWNVATQAIIFISPYDAKYHCTLLQCSLCNSCI